jgi:outer membrane immunogenic protein
MSVGRDLYAGGRITAAVSDAFNLYAKVGYANTRLNLTTVLSFDPSSFSGELEGVRAGVGGQFQISRRAYLGAEYRYTNYEADFSRNQVVGTVGFRF